MALTAEATRGVEPLKKMSGEEVYLIPGTPGVTYGEGARIRMPVGTGTATIAGAADQDSIGSVTRTTVCPGNTQAFPFPPRVEMSKRDTTTATDTLIPVSLDIGGGSQLFKSTFADQLDRAVTTYTAGTRTIVHDGAAFGANDMVNGAVLYVYEGTGAGQLNVVEDYVTASSSIVTLRPFEVALDTTSNFIVLGGEAVADRGVGFFGRLDNAAGGLTLTTADGADDGDYLVVGDFRVLGEYLKNLTLPVGKSGDLF